MYTNGYSEASNWKRLGERWATSVREHISLDNVTMVTRVSNLTIRPRTVQSLQHKYNELKAARIKQEEQEQQANLLRWTQTANTIVEQKLLPYEQIIDGTTTVSAAQLANGYTVPTVVATSIQHKKRKAAPMNYAQRVAFMELCENNKLTSGQLQTVKIVELLSVHPSLKRFQWTNQKVSSDYSYCKKKLR